MESITLHRNHATLEAIVNDAPPTEVRLIYPRPFSDRRQVSVVDVEKKEEIASLESLDQLDSESRKIAEAELFTRYPIYQIEKISDATVDHGQRLIHAETDRGQRYFNLREPSKNITMVTDDHVIIRDSMGNRFEIKSISGLDSASQHFLDLVT